MNREINKDYKLCFIYDGDAYFFKGDISHVWGDDWGDAPYEHNAGLPYKDDEDQFKTVRFFREGDGYVLLEPCEFIPGCINSPYTVEDLNEKKAPWLKICIKECPVEVTEEIYADISLYDFIEWFERHYVDFVVKDYGLNL